MVRKASGYLTKDGQFFPTKQQAEVFEATRAFHQRLSEAVVQMGLEPTAPYTEFLIDNVRSFVLLNKDVVMEYIRKMPSIPVLGYLDEPVDTGLVTETSDEGHA